MNECVINILPWPVVVIVIVAILAYAWIKGPSCSLEMKFRDD